MTQAVVVSLIGLIVIITIQVVFVARWTGRIDGYMIANDKRFESHEEEIRRLRDARHKADGDIQRHEGMIRELNRRHFSRRETDRESESDSGE